jgi:hypothetical protein
MYVYIYIYDVNIKSSKFEPMFFIQNLCKCAHVSLRITIMGMAVQIGIVMTQSLCACGCFIHCHVSDTVHVWMLYTLSYLRYRARVDILYICLNRLFIFNMCACFVHVISERIT